MTQSIPDFIDSLKTLQQAKSRDTRDRAALARLRRGLGEPRYDTFPYVVPYLGDVPEDKHRWFFTVASLFALYPDGPPAKGESLGRSYARLRTEAGEAVDRRFQALLNAHEDDLPGHLRHAVALLKSKYIGVDYECLLRDLMNWTHPERKVQFKWARDYWRPLPPTAAQAQPEARPETTHETQPTQPNFF